MWDWARRRGKKANGTELAGQGMDSVVTAMAGRLLGTEQIAAQQVLGWSMRLMKGGGDSTMHVLTHLGLLCINKLHFSKIQCSS